MITALLIIGIVIIGVGASAYVIGKSLYSECPAFIVASGSIFSSKDVQKCYFVQYSPVGAGVLMMVGIALSIGAVAEKGKDKEEDYSNREI